MKVDPEILLSLYLNDNDVMTDEQLHSFQEWLNASPDHRRQFVYASYIHRSVHDYLTGNDLHRRFVTPAEPPVSKDFPKDGCCEAAFWEALSLDERHAETLVIPSPSMPEELVTDVRRRKAQLATGRARIPVSSWVSLGSLAAVLMLLVYITHFSGVPAQPVATLLDAIDARWDAPLDVGGRLYNRAEAYTLLEGYAKVGFDNGVVVHFDAPARFVMMSGDKMNLDHGRLTAYVPSTAIGFTVDTPNSRIVDLGTEFGVSVSNFGETQIHMFHGKASLVSSLDGQTLESHTLTQHQAKSVDKSGRIAVIQLAQHTFVREINSQSGVVWRGEPLSLADVVGGGDGFGSGTAGGGIDPETGGVRHDLDDITIRDRSASHRFTVARQVPFIDCIFVPGFDDNPTQVTSTGLTCQFPPTSAGFWGYPFKGAWHEGHGVSRHTLMLDDTPLDRAGEPSLTLHPNMGITFDLQQMRQSLSGLTLGRLHARAGLSQTVSRYVDTNPESEFWVLIDGQIRLRRLVKMSDGGFEIDIPISASDRFLSLAVTDGNGDTAFNWAVFVDPCIVLQASQ